MKASQRELFTFKVLLEYFSYSTGLRINFKKSYLVPLNLSPEKAHQLARVFFSLLCLSTYFIKKG
jgi:hypothetical protein